MQNTQTTHENSENLTNSSNPPTENDNINSHIDNRQVVEENNQSVHFRISSNHRNIDDERSE